MKTQDECKKLLTVRVQHPGNVEMLFSNVKGKVKVVKGIILGQLRVVQQVRPVTVDEGTECKTIL